MHIVQSNFMKEMTKCIHDMWLKGWDERNGGNVTYRLLPSDVKPYLQQFTGTRDISLFEPLPALAGTYFLVTGSGKYFRNVILAPEENLGIIQISEKGDGYRILWGLLNDAVPTSELPAHLLSHQEKIQQTNGSHRVIIHTHATNLIALTYVLEPSTKTFTRELWEMSTECLVVFPEGIGVLPWYVPGKPLIGEKTAEMMQKHNLVLWPFHGVFGSGKTLDEAFGLIDTAEKSAEILVKVLSMGGKKQSMTTEDLSALAEGFQVTPLEGIL